MSFLKEFGAGFLGGAIRSQNLKKRIKISDEERRKNEESQIRIDAARIKAKAAAKNAQDLAAKGMTEIPWGTPGRYVQGVVPWKDAKERAYGMNTIAELEEAQYPHLYQDPAYRDVVFPFLSAANNTLGTIINEDGSVTKPFIYSPKTMKRYRNQITAANKGQSWVKTDADLLSDKLNQFVDIKYNKNGAITYVPQPDYSKDENGLLALTRNSLKTVDSIDGFRSTMKKAGFFRDQYKRGKQFVGRTFTDRAPKDTAKERDAIHKANVDTETRTAAHQLYKYMVKLLTTGQLHNPNTLPGAFTDWISSFGIGLEEMMSTFNPKAKANAHLSDEEKGQISEAIKTIRKYSGSQNKTATDLQHEFNAYATMAAYKMAVVGQDNQGRVSDADYNAFREALLGKGSIEGTQAILRTHMINNISRSLANDVRISFPGEAFTRMLDNTAGIRYKLATKMINDLRVSGGYSIGETRTELIDGVIRTFTYIGNGNWSD